MNKMLILTAAVALSGVVAGSGCTRSCARPACSTCTSGPAMIGGCGDMVPSLSSPTISQGTIINQPGTPTLPGPTTYTNPNQ